MPDTYIKKSERERQARIDKSIQTLLALCDDPQAAPEQRLGAVKLLRPIEELQEQLHIKNERISEQDKEILKLKSELEVKTKELELDLPRFSHPCRTEDLSVSANSLGVR
jgi:hypothetical protein